MFFINFGSLYLLVVFMDWKVFFERGKDGWFTVTVPSLPGCISQGRTRAKALKNIKEAIELHVSCLAKEGIPLSGKREPVTVSVRL